MTGAGAELARGGCGAGRLVAAGRGREVGSRPKATKLYGHFFNGRRDTRLSKQDRSDVEQEHEQEYITRLYDRLDELQEASL